MASIDGKRIVFTGDLESMTRAEARAKAKAFGAVVDSSVNAETDMLVAGPRADSKLAAAALKHGVQVLNEKQWIKIAGGGSKAAPAKVAKTSAKKAAKRAAVSAGKKAAGKKVPASKKASRASSNKAGVAKKQTQANSAKARGRTSKKATKKKVAATKASGRVGSTARGAGKAASGTPATKKIAKPAAGAASGLVLLKLVDGWDTLEAARRVLASHGRMIVQRRHGFVLDERNWQGHQLDYGGYGGSFGVDLDGGGPWPSRAFHRTWGLTKLKAGAEAVYTARGSLHVYSSPRFDVDDREERGKPFAGLTVHFACSDAGRKAGAIADAKAKVEAGGGTVIGSQADADVVVVGSMKERQQGKKGLTVTLGALVGVLPQPRKVSTDNRSADARSLWKLLSARDLASINQGLELAAALPGEIDGLLDGCSVDGDGKIVASKRFTGTKPAQPYLNLALLGLLSLAPDRSTAAALRRSVKEIGMQVADVPRLAGFTAMTSLWLRKPDGRVGIFRNENRAAIGQPPQAPRATDLSQFGPMPKLKSIQISLDWLASLSGLDAPRLKEAYVSSCGSLTDLGALSGLEKLANVDLRWCMKLTDLGPLSALKALTSLDLNGCEKLTDLGPLSGLE